MDSIHIAEVLLTLIVGFFLSMTLLPKISLVAFRRRLFDKVDGRKIHTASIPRLGGRGFLSLHNGDRFTCHYIRQSLPGLQYA